MSLRLITVFILLIGVLVATPGAAFAATPEPSPRGARLADTASTSSAGFTHPGVFVGVDELKTSKGHVRAGDEPWATLFDELESSEYATRGAPDFGDLVSASDRDEPCDQADTVGCASECGSFNIPDNGCTDELMDARAVYGQALLWWYTEDPQYARRAVAILNAYASDFAGHVGSNGPLMAAWVSEMMIRGAEIIRYTYEPGLDDPQFQVRAFTRMARTVLADTLSSFDYANYNGNWKLSAADGLVNLGVFLDDRALYEQGLEMWRERVPSYIYLESDGPLPIPPADSVYLALRIQGCRWGLKPPVSSNDLAM
ncbi:alginate lyase family protein [Microbacterium indicum]|uniref:alginate lyase family protein n=1 Tax=Microbacterium indicum TaxID=358100 RepID=UPI000490EAB4|nr:alginate lyase family protein [Microbacterium indicum]